MCNLVAHGPFNLNLGQESQLQRLMAKLAMVRSTRLQSLNRTYPLKLKGDMCILGALASNPSGGAKKQKQGNTVVPAGPDNSTTYFGTLTGVPTGNGTLMIKFQGGIFRSVIQLFTCPSVGKDAHL